MSPNIRLADSKGRVTLPSSFANSAVTIELIGDNEVRVRKAAVMAVDDMRFLEESRTTLTDADRDAFLAALENPPQPNAALSRAVARYREKQDG
jgi:hypothetical protein